MGEANGRRRKHQSILANEPGCIYCAGSAKATTIEHMPPIGMFNLRQRPKGLEFPTCVECNHGTRLSDLVASLMGRMWPDASTDVAQAEVKKLFSAVKNNIPGLLEEMEVGRGGQKLARRNIPNMPWDAEVLRADGPIMTEHMRVFGAKLGFALHYEAFGSPVPAEGGVQPMYFTNANALRGELPEKLIALLPSTLTLEQGRKHVRDQFQYTFRLTEERRHGVYYAIFRASFAVAAVTALDRSESLMRRADRFPVFRPGDFKR
jgi:hypothetical protein